MQTWGPFEWVLMAAAFLVPAAGVGWAAFRLGRGLGGRARHVRVLGWIAIGVAAVAVYPLVTFVFGSFFIKPFFGARALARSGECRKHLRQLSGALILYTQDWDETYPPADRWGDRIASYLPVDERDAEFRCPDTRSPYAYALNRAVAGCPLREIADPETVVLVEHDSQTRNETVDPGTPLPSGRHGLPQVARMDGSVRSISQAAEASLVWDSQVAPPELDAAERR